MAAARVVEGLEEVEDRHPGVGVGAEGCSVKELGLKGGKETLAHGIVVAISYRSHGGTNAGLGTSFPKGQRRVL